MIVRVISPASHHVPLLVVMVFDDEDHVESGQDGGHEVYVVLTLGVIPAAKHGVGSGQNRAARVQGGGDTGLGEQTTDNLTQKHIA